MGLDDWLSFSDEQIVSRVRAGETGLYELLMRRHNQRLYRVLRAVVGDSAEAEDVLQEAWVRAFEHLAQFAGRSRFSTWLTRIAVYEALARTRKGRRFTALDESEPAAPREGLEAKGDDPEQELIRAELKHVMESAVDRLPESYRVVFVLRAIEELSTAETADCLNLSEEAVKTRLHRSRALLRRELESQVGPGVTDAYVFLGARCDRAVTVVMKRIANQSLPDLLRACSGLPRTALQ